MLKSNPSALRVAIVIFAALLLGTGALAVKKATSPASPPAAPTPASPVPPTPLPKSKAGVNILFASSTIGATKVWQVNDKTKDSGLLATLPDKIKHIHYLPPVSLVYIAETDSRDYGVSIKKYDIATQSEETLVSANSGWGIDDILISPDGQLLAWWEVQPLPGESVLVGGFSRVFVKKIGEDSSSLVVMEQALSDKPIHYPLFFDGENRLYLDSFIPNGGGFYLGLYVYNPQNPAGLAPVAGMNDGDYVSDPLLSPDGKSILFASYDKDAPIKLTSPSGSQVNRQSVLNPNQIVFMDLTSGEKTILASSAGNSQYATPLWSDDGLAVFYQKYVLLNTNSSLFDGVYRQDISGGESQPLPLAKTSSLRLLTDFDNQLIWGEETADTGNLSPKYAKMLNFINSTYLGANITENVITLPGIQYLAATGSDLPVLSVANYNTIKLTTFTINSVQEIREDQQNNPQDARRQGLPRCFDLCGIEEGKGNASCHMTAKCSDSPLYLYPAKRTEISVSAASNPIFSADPAQVGDSWQVTAYPDGRIISQGKEYQNISYSYFSSASVASPTKGLVVDSHHLSATLEYFAQNLGLTGGEVTDFVSFWQDYLPRRSFGEGGPSSPYYFISFYSPDDSRRILPLTIDPKPDTLLQIVMYFKPLSLPISVAPPVFEEVLPRTGFTAVDWSGIIEK